MAKPNEPKVETPKEERDETPFSDPATNPDESRKPQVAKEEGKTFDERTSAAQPFMKEDGTQDNGAENPEEAEGAKASQSREGDKNTADEAKQ